MFGNTLPFGFFFSYRKEKDRERERGEGEREKERKEERKTDRSKKKTVETSPNRQTKNKKKTFVVCFFLLVPHFLLVFHYFIHTKDVLCSTMRMMRKSIDDTLVKSSLEFSSLVNPFE